MIQALIGLEWKAASPVGLAGQLRPHRKSRHEERLLRPKSASVWEHY